MKRTGFKTKLQRNEAQAKWEAKKATLKVNLDIEIKAKFDSDRGVKGMSQSQYLKFLINMI